MNVFIFLLNIGFAFLCTYFSFEKKYKNIFVKIICLMLLIGQIYYLRNICYLTAGVSFVVSLSISRTRLQKILCLILIIISIFTLRNETLVQVMRVKLMYTRRIMLENAISGFKSSGVPLVGIDGGKYVPASGYEDSGFFYFVSLMAVKNNLSSAHASLLFILKITISAFLLGILGSFIYFRSWIMRLLTFCVFFQLFWLSMKISDVYIIQISIVLAIVPFMLFFIKKRGGIGKLLPIFTLFTIIAGILCGVADQIRVFSGMAVVIFILPLIVFIIPEKKKSIGVIMLFLFSFSLPYIYFGRVISERNDYLSKMVENYKAPSNHHLLWHNAYIGLGYITNDFGITWADSSGKEMALKKDPSVRTPDDKYYNICKNEFFFFLSEQSKFFFTSIFAKLGVLFFFMLVFTNVGFVASLCEKRNRTIDVVFILSGLFSGLNGLVGIPTDSYLLGFFGFLVLYGLFSIGYIIDPE